MIFYTQTYQNNLHKVLYRKTTTTTTTHTHTLQKLGTDLEIEEEGFQFGFKRWEGWAVNSKWGVQSKRECECHESCVGIVGLSTCGHQKKSIAYETECRMWHLKWQYILIKVLDWKKGSTDAMYIIVFKMLILEAVLIQIKDSTNLQGIYIRKIGP